MDISQGDQRRIGLTVAAGVLLVSAVVGMGFIGRPRNPFEREQARAEALNPQWLSVEITTADNRHEYQESESIVVVRRFSSAVRYRYKADVAEGYSMAAETDRLHISNGEQISLGATAIVCCDSRLIGLDDQPYVPPTLTRLQLRPGEYEMYLTSRRVFKWDAAAKEYDPSSFEVASNLLKIRVVPDSGKAHSDLR